MTAVTILLLLFPSQYYTPEKQLEFADHWFQEEEHREAEREYRRFLFFHPEHTARNWAIYRLGLCYELRGYYSSAINLYEGLESPEADYRVACSLFRSREFEESLQTLNRLKVLPAISERASALEASTLMMLQSWDEAELALAALSDSQELHVATMAKELQSIVPRGRHMSRRNPAIAGVLSAAIPGAGSVYTGDADLGIGALLLTRFMGWLTYDGFRDDGWKSGRGWGFGFSFVTLHLSQISVSVGLAELYNAEQESNVRQEIQESSAFLFADFVPERQDGVFK